MKGNLGKFVILSGLVSLIVAALILSSQIVHTAQAHDEIIITEDNYTSQLEGTLVRALTTFPNSLDLPQASERQAFTTAWQMYDSLLSVDDNGFVVPALAESWEVSIDGREYIFHLRQDVTFHNGEPFNADAVVFSWERASTGDFSYSYHWQRANLVEKINDEYTVKITTEEPDGLFLRIMADNWAMVPPGYFASVGQAGFDAHPMGTGPYKFVEWVPGDYITMEANQDYWQGTPEIDTVIFRPIPDSADRVAALLAGEVDIITRLSSGEAQSLMGEASINVIQYPIPRIYYIAFNNLTTGLGQPTIDPKVRQAMNYAVDIDAITALLFDGYAKPAIGFVATGELGYDNAEPFGYDRDKALQLLSEASYPAGFEIDMACPSAAYTNFEAVCSAIAVYLADVGINVNLEIMESGVYWDLESQKLLPPLFGDSWSAGSGEAYRRLQGALGGWDATYSAWFDDDMAALLNEINVTVDQTQRATLYGDLQQLMREDPPFIYLYEPYTFEAIDVQVQNYKPHLSEEYSLMGMWLDPDGDGVHGSLEDGAPNNGDGNGDGIPDRDQVNVASLPNATEENYLTLESPEDTQLSAVEALENPSIEDAPNNAEFLLDFVAFEVGGIDPGSSITVTLYLPLDPNINSYWRYGPTLDNHSNHWYLFNFDGSTGAEIVHETERTIVYLHYIDGSKGDSDIRVNGHIVDPGAPAITNYKVYQPIILLNR